MYEKLNEVNINCFSFVNWDRVVWKDDICCDCGNIIVTGDDVLLENDVTNGLVVNHYCVKCGKKRLQEYMNWYKKLYVKGDILDV